jgi:hypothetical protein
MASPILLLLALLLARAAADEFSLDQPLGIAQPRAEPQAAAAVAVAVAQQQQQPQEPPKPQQLQPQQLQPQQPPQEQKQPQQPPGSAKADAALLLELKAGFMMENPALASWAGDDACAAPWEGVTCDGGRVVAM